MERKDLYELAEQYGYEMELYGKSLYWTSPRVCEDTTPELKENPLFKGLSYEDQQSILAYGNLRKRWGMGCYQENGANAEMYSKGIPPKNPFESKPKDIEGDER